jgi:kynurenine 3-monooxygenase
MAESKIVIIGAGMAGCFMGICLAQRGYTVEIYESRPDVRKTPYDSGRSFNLTLYYRGIQAMKKAGVWDEVRKIVTIAEGNAAHYENERVVYSPFDTRAEEILYTVHRNNMNAALITSAEQYSSISLHFDSKCVGIDRKNRTVTIKKNGESTPRKISAEIVVGADGLHSIVRDTLLKETENTDEKDVEDWGYKEVHASAETARAMGLRKQATHTWPRQNSLLIAFPNPDDSFTLMFNLPLEGTNSFTALATKESIETYILHQFPDLAPLLDGIVNTFLHKPMGSFTTLLTKQWHDNDFLVLVGDAAHAVLPFYGQGMCAAFDDCLAFSHYVELYKGNWEKIFRQYQQRRKRNTDVLAVLSKENFIELRDKSRSPFYILKDKADTLLHRISPAVWNPPLYVLIAHGDMEYADALRVHRNQQDFAKKYGLDFMLQTAALPWKAVNKMRGRLKK